MIAPINQFPVEILIHIFSYVPPLAVPKIERVCKAWNALAKDKEISALKASMLLQRPILINKIPKGLRQLYINTAQKIKLERLLNKGMVQTGFPNLISDRQQMLFVFARKGKLHLMASHPYMVEIRTNHHMQAILCIQKLQSVVECFVRSRHYQHLESFHLTKQLHYILFAKYQEWPIPSREIVPLFESGFHSLHLLENEDHFFLIKKVEGIVLDILIPFDRGNAPGSCVFTGEPTDFVDGIIPRVDVGRFRIEARKEAADIKIKSYPSLKK